jgi:hypothetical protein
MLLRHVCTFLFFSCFFVNFVVSKKALIFFAVSYIDILLIVCFENPVLCTWSQRETNYTFVLPLFRPYGKNKATLFTGGRLLIRICEV